VQNEIPASPYHAVPSLTALCQTLPRLIAPRHTLNEITDLAAAKSSPCNDQRGSFFWAEIQQADTRAMLKIVSH
jgi:hypothetical protein